MRIQIQSFKVTERWVLSDRNKLWKWLCGKASPDKYHYDCIARISPESLLSIRGLEPKKDFIQLPNKIRLQIWQIEDDIMRLKTCDFVDENLRGYKPIEMYLVYPIRHGHINDRDQI